MLDFMGEEDYTLQITKAMTNQARRRNIGASRKRAATRKAGGLSLRTDVVRLDTRAIRQKALGDYRQAEQKLEQLKKQVQRYHEHDVPGFRAWMHHACGRLLARQRELLNAIEEKRGLLMEIEAWADVHDLSFAAAYRKVLWRRAHPREAEEEDRQMAAKAAKGDGRNPEDWSEDDDWDDPFTEDDFGSPDDAWDAFADMFERMTGKRPPSRAGRGGRQVETPDQKSAKELYRTIVRRLHPDHHGHMNEARKSLWHEAQEAYRAQDVNALYSILARCDEGAGGIGDHTPVSVIRRLILQFKKTMRSVGQDIRRAKSDQAWDFETRVRDPRFVRRIRVELEDTIREAEWHLESLTDTLTSLDRAAARPASPRKPGRARRPPFPDLEPELPF